MWGGGTKDRSTRSIASQSCYPRSTPPICLGRRLPPKQKRVLVYMLQGLWWRCVHTRAFYSCNSVLADYQRGVHIMYIMLSFVFVLLFCVFLVNEAVRHVGSSTLPPTGSLCCPCRVYLWCSMGGIFPPIPPRITPSHLMLFLFRRDG